jgi:pullulanase/glycogen debranching enzyme
MATRSPTRQLVKKMAIPLRGGRALLSEGTSFFQGGEEFLRSKGGQLATRITPAYAVNAFHYDLKLTNADLCALFAKLIALKTTTDFFDLEQSPILSSMSASFNSTANVLTYMVNLSTGKQIKVVAANGYGTPGSVDLSAYDSLYLDSAGQSALSSAFTLANYEVAVAVKGL